MVNGGSGRFGCFSFETLIYTQNQQLWDLGISEKNMSNKESILAKIEVRATILYNVCFPHRNWGVNFILCY